MTHHSANPLESEVARLRAENSQLQLRLQQIEYQLRQIQRLGTTNSLPLPGVLFRNTIR